MPHKSPEAVVQAQLDAYNAKDIDALLATYALDAEQYELHGALLACGSEEMRSRFLVRFAEPDLYANLISRVSMENIVIDHEVVTRNFPDGLGKVEMMCIYEVAAGRIQKASFALGTPQLQHQQAL